MSWEAVWWATKQSVPDCECKLVLLMLANHSDTHESDIQTCWPGIERLCKECILSKNTIRDRLRTLESLGFIKITERKDSDGRNRSNLYTLMVPPDPGGSPDDRGGVTGRPLEGSRDDPETVIRKQQLNLSTYNETVQKQDTKYPVMAEVVVYGSEIGLPADECSMFMDHYASNGWKVGRNPMKDWKAALRNWQRNYVKGQYAKTNIGNSKGSHGPTVKKPDYSKGF